GKSFRRHACTKRRPGTRSTFTPVTCPASVENLPPILLLMTAFRPVTSVRLRESASRSYMAFGGALKRILCLMVLHIPHPFLSQFLRSRSSATPSLIADWLVEFKH